MLIEEFSKINKLRCEEGFNHSIHGWSLSDWMVAILGELGEASNIVKKLNRIRDGLKGNVGTTEEELLVNLKEELADTYIYFDLLCQSLNIDISTIVMEKFNKTSQKIGYPLTYVK